MPLSPLESIVRQVVGSLVDGHYRTLVSDCSASRLTPDDLRAVVNEYGRKLIYPPSNAYENLDAVQINTATVPTWSVRVPLWTNEKGRSDLTLELTIALDQGKARVDLDDLHVL